MHAAALCSWIGLKKPNPSSIEIEEQVRAGLPYSSLEKLETHLDLSTQELSHVLMISPRTLLRRKKTKRFALDESDRVYRLARVVALTDDVLGKLHAKTWLKTPNPALSGKVPLVLLETDIGTQEVVKLLQRYAYGIFY